VLISFVQRWSACNKHQPQQQACRIQALTQKKEYRRSSKGIDENLSVTHLCAHERRLVYWACSNDSTNEKEFGEKRFLLKVSDVRNFTQTTLENIRGSSSDGTLLNTVCKLKNCGTTKTSGADGSYSTNAFAKPPSTHAHFRCIIMALSMRTYILLVLAGVLYSADAFAPPCRALVSERS
jgi:hypothetical protein